MNQLEYNDKINLMEFLGVLWKRKWLIIIPTVILTIAAGIITFLMTPVWEVDAVIQPSKFLVQTQQGQFNEVLVVDPKQVAGQINLGSYNNLISAEFNLDIRKFPKIKAEALRDTKLIRISLKDKDIHKGELILNSLFNHLKGDFDRKIDVEIKDADIQIAVNENEIKQKELIIKDHLSEIKLLNIQKEKTRQEILSEENKLKISEDRYRNISEEMKTVKMRIDEIEGELKKALEEKRQGNDAVALLLYSNEVQNNLRYYDTLNEKLSTEKITQEDLRLSVKGKTEDLKLSDTHIEKLRNEIDKTKADIDNTRGKIDLVKEKKLRIDFAKLIKEPTPSIKPVSPKKAANILIVAILGALLFTMIVFFVDYRETLKPNRTSIP